MLVCRIECASSGVIAEAFGPKTKAFDSTKPAAEEITVGLGPEVWRVLDKCHSVCAPHI